MTAQTFEGFLLTRNWRDTPGGIELEFWFSTAQGPLCALVRRRAERIFPARERAAAGTGSCSADMPGLEIRPVQLRSFSMAPVVGLYFRQYRQARRAADELRARGLDPLEADINPADRYLMERFVAGCGAPVRRAAPPRPVPAAGKSRCQGRRLPARPESGFLRYRNRDGRPATLLHRGARHICRGRGAPGLHVGARVRNRRSSRPAPPRRTCCRPFSTGLRTTIPMC